MAKEQRAGGRSNTGLSAKGSAPANQAGTTKAASSTTSADANAGTGASRQTRRAEIVRQRREQRISAPERQRREWLYKRIAIGTVVLLVVALAGWGGYAAYANYQDDKELKDVASFDYAGNQHVAAGQPVTYSESPPVGGQHDIQWENCGYYAQPIRSENAVHSMEHGAVWITYSPDLPADQVELLKAKADSQTYILVSPYPNLQAPVVVQSWNHQLVLNGATDSRLESFIREYRINPKYTPEARAACTGGISTTVG